MAKININAEAIKKITNLQEIVPKVVSFGRFGQAKLTAYYTGVDPYFGECYVGVRNDDVNEEEYTTFVPLCDCHS